MTKPARGNPKTPDQIAAVATMEAEVVRRGVAGQSFYAIERELGITNAARIFKRATATMERTRENSTAIVAAQLDDLTARAWEKLDADSLDGLARRIAEYLHDFGDEADAQAIRGMIAGAYGDVFKGITAAAGIIDRRTKLEGLNHADRVADARLEVDRGLVEVMAVGLAESLGLLDEVTPERKREVLRDFAERMKANAAPDEG